MHRKLMTLVGATLLLATLAVTQQPATAETSKKDLATAPRTYVLNVLTGNVSGAGTDANVWAQIRGTEGWSVVKELETYGRDDFERGRWDRFNLNTEDIGEPNRVCMQRNNAGLFPDWYLSVVRVYWWTDSQQHYRTALFDGWMPANTWICGTLR